MHINGSNCSDFLLRWEDKTELVYIVNETQSQNVETLKSEVRRIQICLFDD